MVKAAEIFGEQTKSVRRQQAHNQAQMFNTKHFPSSFQEVIQGFLWRMENPRNLNHDQNRGSNSLRVD